MGGELKCTKQDTSKCKLNVLLKDAETGDFIAAFQPDEGLAAIAADTEARNANITQEGRRRMQETQQVINPVVCIEEGGALLFGQVSIDNYPVYQKNSLLNSDPEFDFSAFLQLRNMLEAGADYTFFAHTFDYQGIYVFADS